MSDILDTLYLFVQENRMGETGYQESATYRSKAEHCDQCLTKLQAALGADGQTLLKQFTNDQYALQMIEQEALFRASLSVGMELALLRQIPE